MFDLLRRCRVRVLVSAALVSCALVAQPAAAQAPSDMNVQAAALYRAGVAAAEENRAEDARALFLAALRLKQHWLVAANLADAEASTDRLRDAAEHLEFALRTGGDEISPQERKRMLEIYERARKTVGALTVKIDAPGAEVLVDGKVVGKAPLLGPIFVEPGERTIEARREGYEAAREKRQVVAGSSGEIELKLTPLPASAAGTDCRRLSPKASAPMACGSQAAGPNRTVFIVGIAGTAAAAGAGIVLLNAAGGANNWTDRAKWGVPGAYALGGAALLGGVTALYGAVTSSPKAGDAGAVRVGVLPGGVVVTGAF